MGDITVERIREYFSEIFARWDEKIPLWEYLTEKCFMYNLIKYLENFYGITKESITIENINEYFAKIFASVDKKIHLWEHITIKYEFGKELIEDVEKFLGINKDSITVERIKSFLLENAEDLISDSTTFFILNNNYDDDDEFSRTREYFKRKYPNQYQRYLIQKTDSKGNKSLNSFF